jgi:hypothetical protein
MSFPKDIQDCLVSHCNPHGDITNSDLKLAGAILHHACATECFNIWKRTILSQTDNLATLFWSCKGSVTTTIPAAALLCQLAHHRRYHRYISLSNYLPGDLNNAADDASRLQHLSAAVLLTHFNNYSLFAYPLLATLDTTTKTAFLRDLVSVKQVARK